MKKHLLGLAIFSFIVVSFAATFAFIYVPKVQKPEEIKITVVETNKPKRCVKNNVQLDSIELIQPMIATESRKGVYEKSSDDYQVFSATLKKGDLPVGTKLAFYFFASESGKIRYIASEREEINRFFLQNDEYVSQIRIDLGKWSKKIGKKNNFYVIPQIIKDFSEIENIQPNFNSEKSFPILWNEEKTKIIYGCPLELQKESQKK